jgi:cellulose synthase/poly-beta-1,6-N-acetylglucosamine synthase-like glycosyltransferase
MAPKKWALNQGINDSNGEIIMTTDADCIPGPEWISSIISYFTENVGFVAGYSPLNRYEKTSFLKHLLALDALALASVAAGSFGMLNPLTCSGRNLAYRKSVYHEVGGFFSFGHLVSGDDDMLMHTIKHNTDWKFRYAYTPKATVSAYPANSLKDFYHQRIRHASKGKYYNKHFRAGLIALYLLNLILLFSLLFIRLWPLFIFVLCVKSFSEFLLIRKMAAKFDQKHLLRFFPIALLIHFIYVVIFGFLGFIGHFQWKSDSFDAQIQENN